MQDYYDGYSVVSILLDGMGHYGWCIFDVEKQELIDTGDGYPMVFEDKLKAYIKIDELIDEKIDKILLVKP